MSKLLTGLMEAERRRQQAAAAGKPPPAAAIDAGHDMAESLAVAGSRADMEAGLAQRAALQEQSDRHAIDQAAALALAEQHLEVAARRRADAEAQAALAARNRAEQETAAGLATVARIEAEREAAESMDRRLEEEAAALAAAQQSERMAAELAAAAASRAAKEAELSRLATERAAAERCAADRAATQLQAQRAAEAAARSRAAAEEEARQQTLRRVEQEAEVSRAAARFKSEGSAGDGQAHRDAADLPPVTVFRSDLNATADLAGAGSAKVAARQAGQRDDGRPAAFGRLVAALALSMGIGVAAGFWLGGPAQAPATSSGSVAHPLPAADPDATLLRLDHELRAVSITSARNLPVEP